MKIEAKPGTLRPQVKACLEPPEAGRGKEVFSPRAFGGSMAPLPPRFQTSGLQNNERIIFCCFKPSRKLIQHLTPSSGQVEQSQK